MGSFCTNNLSSVFTTKSSFQCTFHNPSSILFSQYRLTKTKVTMVITGTCGDFSGGLNLSHSYFILNQFFCNSKMAVFVVCRFFVRLQRLSALYFLFIYLQTLTYNVFLLLRHKFYLYKSFYLIWRSVVVSTVTIS